MSCMARSVQSTWRRSRGQGVPQRAQHILPSLHHCVQPAHSGDQADLKLPQTLLMRQPLCFTNPTPAMQPIWGKRAQVCAKLCLAQEKPVISFYTLLCGFLHCLATGQPVFCRSVTWTHREAKIGSKLPQDGKIWKQGVSFWWFCTRIAGTVGPGGFSRELNSESIERAGGRCQWPVVRCAWAFHLMPSTPPSSHRLRTASRVLIRCK